MRCVGGQGVNQEQLLGATWIGIFEENKQIKTPNKTFTYIGF
jgi:hypothetical protein